MSSLSPILLLSCAAFFSGAALRVCDALIPRLAADFSITAGTAGRVMVGFSVAYGLMQLVFGPLADRFGKARLVACALAGCAAAATASALAPGFASLVGLRVLWGMAAAGIIPLAIAWIGDTVPYQQRQPTLARLATGTLGGMMGGQLAGGLFAESQAGWRGAFLLLAAGYAVVALLLWPRVRGMTPAAPEQPAPREAMHHRLGSVLRVPWARVVLVTVLAEGMLIAPMAYLPAYLNQRFGLPLASASALVALYAVGGLAYSMSARRIVPWLGERRMVAGGGVLVGLGFLGWAVTPAGALAGPLALVVGFGTYLFHNTLQTHATQMAPAQRGSSVALFAFCLFLGGAIGVSLAGWAFDRWGALPILLVPAAALPLVALGFARGLAARH